MPSLPRYNPKAVCAKCGGKDVATTYCAHRGHLCGDFTHGFEGPPLMHRRCKRCGYNWSEVPKDG